MILLYTDNNCVYFKSLFKSLLKCTPFMNHISKQFLLENLLVKTQKDNLPIFNICFSTHCMFYLQVQSNAVSSFLIIMQ